MAGCHCRQPENHSPWNGECTAGHFCPPPRCCLVCGFTVLDEEKRGAILLEGLISLFYLVEMLSAAPDQGRFSIRVDGIPGTGTASSWLTEERKVADCYGPSVPRLRCDGQVCKPQGSGRMLSLPLVCGPVPSCCAPQYRGGNILASIITLQFRPLFNGELYLRMTYGETNEPR